MEQDKEIQVEREVMNITHFRELMYLREQTRYEEQPIFVKALIDSFMVCMDKEAITPNAMLNILSNLIGFSVANTHFDALNEAQNADLKKRIVVNVAESLPAIYSVHDRELPIFLEQASKDELLEMEVASTAVN